MQLFCWPFTFTEEGIYLGKAPKGSIFREYYGQPLDAVIPGNNTPQTSTVGGSIHLPASNSGSTEPEYKPISKRKGKAIVKTSRLEREALHSSAKTRGNRSKARIETPQALSRSSSSRSSLPSSSASSSSSHGSTLTSSHPSSSSSSFASSSSTSSSASSYVSFSSETSAGKPFKLSKPSNSIHILKYSSDTHTSFNQNGSVRGLVRGPKHPSKKTSQLSVETVKKPELAQRHNGRKAPQSVKVAETSSLAPVKKKVRFAPMVDERSIPEAEHSRSSTSSSSSSNTSDDSYTSQNSSRAVRYLQTMEQRPPGTDKTVRSTKRMNSSATTSKSVPKNKAHAMIEDRKSGRAKFTRNNSFAGSSHLSGSRGAIRKLKPIHPTLDAIIISRSGLASNKENSAEPWINEDTHGKLKDRSSKRSSPFQKPSVTLMSRHKIMKGNQSRSANRNPPPGLQYDARTGRLFRDV